MLLVCHGDSPGSLEVKPQPGQLAPEPGKVREVARAAATAAAHFLEGGLRGPGEVGKGKYLLDLLRSGDLIQDPPAPLVSPGSRGELDPVTSPILAVDVEEEEISLLQVINQTKRNVQKAGRTGHVKSAK